MEFREKEKEKLIREAQVKHAEIIPTHPWLLFGLLFVLAGCGRVGLEIETVVREDGSFDRTVTYTTRASDRETLAKEYHLPAGAAWEVTETTKLSDPPPSGFFRERLSIYRARGTFRSLETDYAKRDAKTPPSFSRNRIAIRVAPDSYEYREIFSDTTDVAALRHLGERFVRESVERDVTQLQGTVLKEENSRVTESIQRHVATSALGYFDQVWHGLERAESKEEMESAATLWGQLGEYVISQIDRWWKTEGQHYPGPEARKRIVQVLTDSSDEKSESDEVWLDSFKSDLERCGGAYLFSSFFVRSYHFKVTVTMPNDIIESNADQIKDNTAVWDFDPLLFLMRDYTLVAKSKRSQGD